jgi:hypothetical protein
MKKTLASLVTHPLPTALESGEFSDSESDNLWPNYVLSLLSGSGMADGIRGDFPEYLLLEDIKLSQKSGRGAHQGIDHVLREKHFCIRLTQEFKALLALIQAAYEEDGRSPVEQIQILVTTTEPTTSSSTEKYWAEARGVHTPEGLVALIEGDGSPWLAHNPFTESKHIELTDIDETQPESILLPLLQSLAEADFDRFVQFWTPGNSVDNIRQRYIQFLRVYEACNGLITFDGYDPDQRPELYPGCRQVRMYVTRHFSNGEKGRSPLVMVKQNAQWALFRGSI